MTTLDDVSVRVMMNNAEARIPPLSALPSVRSSDYASEEMEVRVGYAQFFTPRNASGVTRETTSSVSKRTMSQDDLNARWRYAGFMSNNPVQSFTSHLRRITSNFSIIASSDWEYIEDHFYDAAFSLLPAPPATTQPAAAAVDASNTMSGNDIHDDSHAAQVNGNESTEAIKVRDSLKHSRLRHSCGDGSTTVTFHHGYNQNTDGMNYFCEWMGTNKRLVVKNSSHKNQQGAVPYSSRKTTTTTTPTSTLLKTKIYDTVEAAVRNAKLPDFHVQWSIETQLKNVIVSTLPIASSPLSGASDALRLSHPHITMTRIKRRKSLFISIAEVRRLLFGDNSGATSPSDVAFLNEPEHIHDAFVPSWRVDFTVCWQNVLPGGESVHAARRDAANFDLDSLSGALVQPKYEIELECISVQDEIDRTLGFLSNQGEDASSSMNVDDGSEETTARAAEMADYHASRSMLVKQAIYLAQILFLENPQTLPIGEYRNLLAR